MEDRRAKLVTRDERRKLGYRKVPYYWRVRKCRGLGYRRLSENARGVWWAMYLRKDGRERQKVLGTADDDRYSDGVEVLNFHQALVRAEAWFAENESDAAPDRCEYEYASLFPDIPNPPPYTVGNAAKDYMAWFLIHRRGINRQFSLIKNRIVPPLGKVPLDELNPPMLQAWFDGLINQPPILATGRISGPLYAELSNDPDAVRKRKNTANTTLAAL